ncbi:uncharacterized protein KY384_004760 [Bacidia gigantensis]|uniref:uncharacterized protein n=1 Tax=Bacidia gigantensis TaxID=2732470 RepID=UPI001D036994|nr:uncharacterized protein KY384_004760 [Bacidia gigantensis]KAG8530259.1 hypothetical protein KY384_004760 [Bacidia gigantensis]
MTIRRQPRRSAQTESVSASDQTTETAEGNTASDAAAQNADTLGLPRSSAAHDNLGTTIPLPDTNIQTNSAKPRSLKYLPKNSQRRSQIEREALERIEAQRLASLQENEGRSIGSLRPSASVRGRGGALGSRGRPITDYEASGVLGGDYVKETATNASKKPRESGQKITAADREDQAVDETANNKEDTNPKKPTRAGVKKEDVTKINAEKEVDEDTVVDSSKRKRKAAATKTKVKQEDQGLDDAADDTHWDEDIGPKYDIAHISLISDDEYEDDGHTQPEFAKGKQKETTPGGHSWQLRPVRLERQEHVGRQIGINTEASSLTSAQLRKRAKEREDAAGSLFLDPEAGSEQAKTKRKPKDVEFVRKERKWKGVYEDEDDMDEVRVKTEQADEEDLMLVDDAPDTLEVDQLRATHGAQRPSAKGVKGDSATTRPDELEFSAQPITRRRKICGYRDPKSIHNTAAMEDDADFAEMIRIWKDICSDPDMMDAESTNSTAHTEKRPDLSGLKGDHTREGKVYLVQLPPILPSLRNATKPAPQVKTEPQKSKSKSSTSDPTIKPDPGTPFGKLDQPSKTTEISNAYNVTNFTPESGCPGTLTFYESGKIRAEWGGLDLEIAKMQTAGFAQEVLLHDYSAVNTKMENQDGWEEVVRVGTEAWAVGPVEGGMVGGLDWETLLG